MESESALNISPIKLDNFSLNPKTGSFYLLNPFYPLNQDYNKLPANPLFIFNQLKQEPLFSSQNFTSFKPICSTTYCPSTLPAPQGNNLINLKLPLHKFNIEAP